MYPKQWLKYAALGLLTVTSSAAFAQSSEVGARNAANPGSPIQGQPGETVEVELFYISNGAARSYQFDVTASDLSLIEGGDAGIDISRCLESAPDLAVTDCTFQSNDTFRVGQADLTTPIPDVDPIGVVTYQIANSATPDMDSFTLDITDWDVQGVDDADVTTTGVTIEVVSGPPAVLGVSPTAIDYGSGISPTTLGPESVTVFNNGDPGAPDLSVSATTFTGPDAAQYSIVGGTCGDAPFSVAAGASCTLDVELAVNDVATFEADLEISTDVGDEAVALTGEGTAGPVASFSIDPDTAAFGQVDLNDMPQSIVHTITNDGDDGSTLELNDLGYTGDDAFGVDTDCPATLGAGDTCTVTVTFDTDMVGNYTGTVSASTNVGDFDVPVSGEAVAAPNVTVDPPFGPVDLGEAGAGETIVADGLLSNTGSADADVACSFTSNPDGVFSAAPSPLEATVSAGGEVPFSLSCAIPDDAETGDTFNATLECTVDGDVAGTHQLECATQNFMAIPVNTLQPWALALFALLMLLAGGVGIRFFRAG
jgi:hypothetical protein